jgi:hypothetical protein
MEEMSWPADSDGYIPKHKYLSQPKAGFYIISSHNFICYNSKTLVVSDFYYL